MASREKGKVQGFRCGSQRASIVEFVPNLGSSLKGAGAQECSGHVCFAKSRAGVLVSSTLEMT